MTSAISASVRPLFTAARTCRANSSQCRKATVIASVSRLRSRLARPGRCQRSPQAVRVMKSWKAAVNGVVAATARSTCAFPRTSRRVRIPAARRSSSVLGPVGSFTWYLPCRWRGRRSRGAVGEATVLGEDGVGLGVRLAGVGARRGQEPVQVAVVPLGQQGGQGPAGLPCPPDRIRGGLVRRPAAERWSEGIGQRLREARLDSRGGGLVHASGGDAQDRQALGQRGRRRADGGEQLGQGRPLAVPGAGG